MSRVDAGVTGMVDLNLGPDPTGSNDLTPKPHHPAFWAIAVFVGAVLFLLVTYLGGFRLIG